MIEVDMAEIAEEYRLSHWAEIVREREESGLTIREFCKNAGFHENRYFYWQKKLRKAACEELGLIQGKTTSMTPAVFAEVKLPAQHAMAPIVSIHNTNISVEAAGVRLTAGSDYPIAKVAELLRMVSQECY